MKWLWLSGVIILLDQWTKNIAEQALVLHQPIAVTPFLNMTLMHNYGAAFSLFNDAGGWQRWFFIGLAVLVSVGIIAWLKFASAGNLWLQIALSLVVGGAVGNLWDRIALGYVVDFIDFRYQTLWWPAFNIADSAICVGAAILVIDSFKDSDNENG
jgi:signal peptidase II